MTNTNTKRTETTASTISARILALKASGLDTRAAFDAVLGAGSYDRLASELYDALRA